MTVTGWQCKNCYTVYYCKKKLKRDQHHNHCDITTCVKQRNRTKQKADVNAPQSTDGDVNAQTIYRC